MLTGLKLGNFKAFADTQNIPIKPLTLIYGANSAGKSSIIHGLLLGCHASETGNLDAHQIRLGGKSVNLGGFRQYVHQRDCNRNLQWAVQFPAQEPANPAYGFQFDGIAEINCSFGLPKGGAANGFEAPFLQTCDFKLNGDVLFRTVSNEANITSLSYVNEKHEFFSRLTEPLLEDDVSIIDDEAVYNEILGSSVLTESAVTDTIQNLISAKVDFSSQFIPTRLTPEWRKKWDKLYEKSNREKFDLSLGWNHQEGSESDYKKFVERAAINLMAVRTLVLLQKCVYLYADAIKSILHSVSYLGPLRSYPPRRLASANDYDQNWYAGGGYAWEIVRQNDTVRVAVNSWLGAEHLQTQYEMSVRRYTAEDKTSDYLEELVLRDKRFDTVVSHRDVGFGISQVLPVLVSAYASENRTIAIEQPEIHLHPALQAELGDVFIQSALGENRNTFLLETHSEHLLLRIMRRMRETERGTLPEGMPPVRPEDVAVLFVQPKQDNSTSVVTELRLDEEGRLVDEWPGGFFEEGFKERFS